MTSVGEKSSLKGNGSPVKNKLIPEGYWVQFHRLPLPENKWDPGALESLFTCTHVCTCACICACVYAWVIYSQGINYSTTVTLNYVEWS